MLPIGRCGLNSTATPINSKKLDPIALILGNGTGAVIQALAFAWLGRIAGASIISPYVLFVSLVAPLATISHIKLDDAIVFIDSPRRRGQAFVMALTAIVLFAILASALAWKLSQHFESWSLVTPWTVLLGTVAMGLFILSQGLLNAEEKYRSISFANFLRPALVGLSQIGLIYAGRIDAHLVMFAFGMGTLLVAAFMLVRVDWRGQFALPGFDAKDYRDTLHEVRRFPILAAPSLLMSSLSAQSLVYYLSFLNFAPMIAAYGMASRVVGFPARILSSSLGGFFMKRIAVIKSEGRPAWPSLRRYYLTIGGLGLAIFSILFFFAPAIFVAILGPDWSEAGIVARIIIPWILLVLVIGPTTRIFSVFGAQAQEARMQALLFGLRILGMWIGQASGATFGIVIGFTIASCLGWILYLLSLRRIVTQAEEANREH
jgi:O-antigen/teichoic acid export membrane protein